MYSENYYYIYKWHALMAYFDTMQAMIKCEAQVGFEAKHEIKN